jgi:fluoride exporter
MTYWIAVALGGSVGAVLRWATELWCIRRFGPGFPVGTLAVNLCGSLILGLVSGLALAGNTTALVGTGFCGALTTFSGFAAQVLDMTRLGAWRGVSYALGSLSAGLLCASLGFYLGGLWA